MKDRRYRMELQLVRVPVIWRAKIPEKMLQPAKRRMTDKRIRQRRAREAAAKFMAALFDGVPGLFQPEEVFKQLNPSLELPVKKDGQLIVLRRYRPIERRAENGPDAGHEGSGGHPGL